ncbi:hypothetical protein K437DRAFT_256333 [Tilletiaria anomala UBC 951]|uniref:mRNA decay factor PAT1 domain-containing protein n=1 Tax=Tilletiaria anomala (strain ATCC 24038 / CBS 436.72 / UBC 951) TaxID=1037660 RepID=A0A066W4Y9_TILAU|nr:uncharacterized protein K437DRAFT_256333 [Tilletiaria anomala UBC 951]KDN46149.1 hypothetical protein K437DRAFT_256333 [Tilletiaria anomala UBC 951]
MSFFGFDVTLPRDRPAASSGGPLGAEPHGDAFDPTFDPTYSGEGGLGDEDDDPSALDAKISALTAGAQEDVAVYTWGEEDYDGLGDRLDEGNDAFNDDTFGVDDVGTDFNFGHGPAAAVPAASVPAPPAISKSAAAPLPSKFASKLDDFMTLDSTRSGPRAGTGAATSSRPVPKTMEEIEAEMRGSRITVTSQQQQQQPSPAGALPPFTGQQLPPPGPHGLAPLGRQPLTMEEIEAQMRQARGPPPLAPQPDMQPAAKVGTQVLAPTQAKERSGVADLASIMRQQQQQQQQQLQEKEILQRQQAEKTFLETQRQGANGTPIPPGGIMHPPFQGKGNMPPAALAMQQAANAQAEAQAMHFVRMKALLDSMPDTVQQTILSLPPSLQFESLDNVVEAFPALRQVRSTDVSKPDVAKAIDTLQVAAIGHIHETVRRKIEEIERQEAKLRRKLAKIQAMSKHNGLMTRSDQDFITRIQVSQLVTPDPYTDDFYAHIYFALRGGRGPSAPVLGESNNHNEMQKNGRNKKQPRLSRRENAMLRMQQQVERIVKHRKERDEKSANGIALEGALGRITASSTKGMRQMLSLPSDGAAAKFSGASDGAASGAQDAVRAALAGASLGQSGAPGQKRQALGKHEVLRILEKLYDTVLALEQLRRNAPAPGDPGADAAAEALEQRQAALTVSLWKDLRVLEPLDISDPHPFVSLISTSKGKRLLPRALRHLTPEQTLTTMTMIVASFQSLDVVKYAHLLDGESTGSNEPSAMAQREDVERQTEAFANSIVPSMMQLIASAPMKIVSGMLAVFIERNDAVRVARSRPGIAFLTIFLSRAESLRQGGGGIIPSTEDLEQWSQIFSLLFQRLSTPCMLPGLFPSTRARASLPFGPGYYMSGAFGTATLADAAKDGKKYRNIDIEDEPVWNFMAALAVACSMEQQQTLVAELRDKILENVVSAKEWAKRKKTQADQRLGGLANELSSAGFSVNTASVGAIPGMELGPDVRIRNVNLLLHALSLDATQIDI